MAAEEAGLDLFIDGDDAFNSTLEKLNETLAALTSAVESLSEMMDTTSVSIDSLSDTLTTLNTTAEEDANSIGDVGESASEADDSIAAMGESAEDASEGLDDSASSTEAADTALANFADTAGDTEGAFSAASEIIIGGLRKIGEVAVEGLLSAGASLLNFATDSFKGALEAEQGMARLTAQIKAQGDAAAITADQAIALADKFKNLAGGSDDAVISAEAVLLKFNNISGESFPDVIRASADLAALMGISLPDAAQLLGYSLDTGGESIARIAKQTGAFTEAELGQIKVMREAGDIAGANKFILENLQDAIGGTAEALANTTAGQWQSFMESVSDTGEGIASEFLPTLLTLGKNVLPIVAASVGDVADSIGGVVTLLATGDFTGGIFGLQEDDPYINALFILRDGVIQLWEISTAAFVAIPGVISAAQEIIGGAFDALVIKAQPVISASTNIQTAFEASVPQIQGAVNTALTFVQNLWNTVFPSILSTTDNTLNQIMTLTATILNSIAVFWAENGDMILARTVFTFEAISAVIGGTLALISGVISATLSVINGDWEAAGAALTSSTAAFMNAILSIVGTDLETFTAVWSGVFDNLKTIVNATFSNVILAVSGGILNAIAAAKAVLGGFYDIGHAIIEGMVQGVVDAAVSLANSVADAVSAAIDTAQNIAGIHSPSEVARKKVGQPIGEGVAVGINDTINEVERAMTASVNAAISPPATSGQMMAQTVFNNNNANSLTINANYPMQSQRSVGDDLRLWGMLTGNA